MPREDEQRVRGDSPRPGVTGATLAKEAHRALALMGSRLEGERQALRKRLGSA